MPTRQSLLADPVSGDQMVLTQVQTRSGEWSNAGIVPATPADIARIKAQVVDAAPQSAPPPPAPKKKPLPMSKVQYFMNDAPEPAAPAPAGTTGSDNEHARLSPSSSKQWLNCTASLAFIEANSHRVVSDEGSFYASEGTRAHEYAADVLTGKISIEDVPDGEEMRDADFPESDFRPHVEAYVDHCMALLPKGSRPLVEVRVPLFYQPDQKGTCDFAWISDTLVIIRDKKYGAGVLVKSFENTQLAIYAMSLIREWQDMQNFTPDTVVNIAAFQPRHHEGTEQIAWEITLKELKKFCENIDYRATQCKVAVDRVIEKLGHRKGQDISPEEILEAAPGVKFAPGFGDDGACRWCDARAWCKVKLAAAVEEMVAPGAPDPAEMIAAMPDLTKEQTKNTTALERIGSRLARAGMGGLKVDDAYLVSCFAARKAVEAQFKDIAEYLEERALAGQPVAGTKLVAGNLGNRKWADEEAAGKWLKNQGIRQADRYTFKLKGPAPIEKLLAAKLKKSTLSKNRFEALVTRGEGKKVLALESDEREAVGTDVDMMPHLDDETDFLL